METMNGTMNKGNELNELNELKLWSFVNENYEMSWRNRKATEYSEGIANKKSKRKAIIFYIIAVAIGVLLMGVMVVKAMATENGYYIKTNAKQTDGSYYVYVTEKKCEVIEVDTTRELVTVDYKGNAYSFYGDGYTEGEQIICQFTDAMEIMGIVE